MILRDLGEYISEVGRQREITTFTAPITRAFSRGWLADGRVVLAKLVELNQDSTTGTIEVLLVGADGTVTTAGPISNGILGTARLDPERELDRLPAGRGDARLELPQGQS